jgi:RimJ/RimL family protein N-acetyltransferase
MMEMILGRQIALRNFLDSDITDQHISWLNDPLVMKFSRHYGALHTRETCSKYLISFTNTGNLYLAIIDVNESIHIGSMTIYFNADKSEADIGILLGDSYYWGRGFAKDAMLTVIEYLQTFHRVSRVTCGTRFDNVKMIKLAEACGMSQDKIGYVDDVQFFYFSKAINR